MDVAGKEKGNNVTRLAELSTPTSARCTAVNVLQPAALALRRNDGLVPMNDCILYPILRPAAVVFFRSTTTLITPFRIRAIRLQYSGRKVRSI